MAGVDLAVLEYHCHDSAVAQQLGSHSKEKRWKLQVFDSTLEVKVNVDKSIGHYAQVRVECDLIQVFPWNGNGTKAKMTEDFIWSKQYRGPLKNIGIKDFFEVRPWVRGSANWFIATVTKQREDGLHEATVKMPDGKGGWAEEIFNSIPSSDIRETKSKKGLASNERRLVLMVPKSDPLMTKLSVDDEVITHIHFVRPTPLPLQGAKRIDPKLNFKVTKDRKRVDADVGPILLRAFNASESYLVTQSNSRLQHSWTFQIGPHVGGEHTIAVEKKWPFSKIVTLTVDGSTLAEAAPEDLNCENDIWQCKFQFKGVKKLAFEVFETTKDGQALDTKATVTKTENYGAVCQVKIPDGMNLGSAELEIDGRLFHTLSLKPAETKEATVTLSPEAFKDTYAISVPSKVNETAVVSTKASSSWNPLRYVGGTSSQNGASQQSGVGFSSSEGFFGRLISSVGCKSFIPPCCSGQKCGLGGRTETVTVMADTHLCTEANLPPDNVFDNRRVVPG